MALSSSDLIQLGALLGLAVLLFAAAYFLPRKVAAALLVLLIPVQPVETRFATANVALAYVIFLALLLKRERISLPFLVPFAAFLFWCFVSMALMHPSTYLQHGVYIASLLSAYFVFWICYHAANHFENRTTIINLFVAMNVVVLVYCVIQLAVGPGVRVALFGVREMSMTQVRPDGRLTGPFESAEITAQYLLLMQFLLLHQFWYVGSRARLLIVGIVAANLACLVATGSRGEFLLLFVGGAMYLWLFRKRIGTARTIGVAVSAVVLLTVMSAVIVNYTSFGRLFDRLEATEVSGGVPDTRAVVWPIAWAEIVKNPFVGHGPQFRFPGEDDGVRYEHHVNIMYPHNLYMFMLFTVGIPGAILFTWILVGVLARCWRAMIGASPDPNYSDLARVGLICVVLYMIDGLKIDQMRFNLVDYWHFSFALFGVLVAASDRVEAWRRLQPLSAAVDRPVLGLVAQTTAGRVAKVI